MRIDKFYENIEIFLSAIWLPHGQLWAPFEEAASLTKDFFNCYLAAQRTALGH